MNLTDPVKKMVLLFGIGIAAIIFLIVALFSFRISPNNSPEIKPTNSPIASGRAPEPTLPPITVPISSDSKEIYSQDYIKKNDEQIKSDTTKLSQDAAVSKFVDSLPYQGNYVSVSYTISDNKVHAVFNKDHQNEANQEFDQLIKQYGIEDKKWINDLMIELK